MSKNSEFAVEALGDLPRAITYLTGSGWTYVGRAGEESFWRFGEEASRRWELIVPLSPAPSGAVRRTMEALTTISALEQREVPEIMKDIRTSRDDVVRIRTEPSSRSGSASMDDALSLIQASRDAIESAASTIGRPRAVLGGRKPDAARQFAGSVELSTEPGSFVIAMASPISAVSRGPLEDVGLSEDIPDHVLFDPEEPFARRANQRLFEAVSAAVSVEDAMSSDTVGVSAFDRTVDAGVSANLLESLVKLGSFEDSNTEGPIRRPYTLSARWAFTRPQPATVPSEITITRDAILTFAEVATIFRKREPQPESEITGQLTGNIDAEEDAGTTIVRALIAIKENEKPRWRQVKVVLNETQYLLARSAHLGRNRVRAVGDLQTSGRLELRNVSTFEIAEDDPDTGD